MKLFFIFLFLLRYNCLIKDLIIDYSEKYSDFENILLENRLNLSKDLNIVQKVLNVKDLFNENYDSLSSYLHKKKNLTTKIVEAAEDALVKYTENHKLKYEDIEYVSATDKIIKNLHSDPKFPVLVNFNKSFVHIPTEVCEKKSKIYRVIHWSKDLEPIFKRFYDESPDVKMLYFASETGVMRFYPGLKWQFRNVDLFDVRRHQWFLQGAAAPKAVLFMIDTSGSMHGRAINIAKMAVEQLLNVLSYKDFVAVGQFPGKSTDLDSKDSKIYPHLLSDNSTHKNCEQTFVHATRKVKNRILAQLDRLITKRMAVFEEAVLFAIDLFKNFSATLTDQTVCGQYVVILTDDGVHYNETVLEQLRIYKKLHVFTYSVGEQAAHFNEKEGIDCKISGFYKHFAENGAITNMLDHFWKYTFLPKHNIRMAPKPELIIHKSQDIFYNKTYKGENMASFTMPFYDKAKEVSFRGLIGMETSINDLMRSISIGTYLGPSGYYLITDPNRFLLTHPNLVYEFEGLQNPATLELFDVEFNTLKEKDELFEGNDHSLHTKIINDFIRIPDQIHTFKKERNYLCRGLTEADLKLCFVHDSGKENYYDASNMTRVEITGSTMDDLEINGKNMSNFFTKYYPIVATKYLIRQGCSMEGILNIEFYEKKLNNQLFGIKLEGEMKRYYRQANESSLPAEVPVPLNETLEDVPTTDNVTTTEGTTQAPVIVELDHSTLTCLRDILFEILMKMKEGYICPKQMQNQFLFDLTLLSTIEFPPIEPDDRILSWSLSLPSGISIHSDIPKDMADVFVKEFQEIDKSSFHQRDHTNEEALFVTKFNTTLPDELHPLHVNRNVTEPGSVFILNSFENRIGHFGITYNGSYVRDLLAKEEICQNRNCYLLDDGAYVISHSGMDPDSVIGQFLGNYDNLLMRELLAKNIYKPLVDHDFQAVCIKYQPLPSSAKRMAVIISKTLRKLFSSKFWISTLKRFNEFILNSGKFLLAVINIVPIDGAKFSEKEVKFCEKMGTLYYSDSSEEFINEIIEADGRKWSHKKVESSNVRIVSVEYRIQKENATHDYAIWPKYEREFQRVIPGQLVNLTYEGKKECERTGRLKLKTVNCELLPQCNSKT